MAVPDMLKRVASWRSPYLLFVGSIMLLLLVYYLVICTDRYVSKATVIVQKEEGSTAALSGGLFTALGGSSPTMLEAQLVKSFIKSDAMLGYLDETLKLREHYSQNDIDRLSRLKADATREKFLTYYLDHIEVLIDETSMTIAIDVQAFSPEYAQQLNQAIVSRAERFVNEISQQLAREQVRFIEGEIESASKRLQNDTNRMVQYQQDNQLLSVDTEAALVSQIISNLQAQLANEHTAQKELLSYLSPSAPEVVASRRRISALENQLKTERARQLGTGDVALNKMMLGYKELELRVEIATQMYQTGLQTLESARLDAARKVKYLVSVTPPTLPQASEEPRRAYLLGSFFLLLNAVYLIGSLVIATIKDHQE